MKNFAQSLREAIKPLPGYRQLSDVYHKVCSLGFSEQHWTRIVMNRETTALVENLQPQELKVLEISGSQWGHCFRFKDYKHIHYPELDICESRLDESFDLIIAEQVFEHLRWPYRAGKHIHEMLNPEGHFLLTTPFLLRVHLSPTDCSRWTESGIKYLLAECGFNLDKIRTGSWGNRACVRGNFDRWKKFHPLLHTLRNEPDFPVSVWALAQK